MVLCKDTQAKYEQASLDTEKGIIVLVGHTKGLISCTEK